MPTIETPTAVADETHLTDLARQCLYRLLALTLSDPDTPGWEALLNGELHQAALDAAEVLREASTPPAAPTPAPALAPGELPPDRLDIEAIVRFLRDPGFAAENEYHRTFGLLVSKKCPPYETEYCPQTLSIYRQQVMADVGGFYRAFGVEPSRQLPERHDHIALELEFMAWLVAKEYHARRCARPEEAQLCRDAQATFLRDHLVWWVPAFAAMLRFACEATPGGPASTEPTRSFYGAVATALSAWIHLERVRFELEAPQELSTPRPSQDNEEAATPPAGTVDCGWESRR